MLTAWLVATFGEPILYHYSALPKNRLIVGWTIIVILLVTSTVLLWGNWPVWLGAWLLGLYRVINLLRFLKNRLSFEELQRISLRAFTWILAAQLISSSVAWLAYHYHAVAVYGFDVLIASQVLLALIIVRVSINTWLHTRPRTLTVSYGDKELPSVSVLVPARNETAALEACLQALVASDYPKLEIIVLDDCSANRRTPEIIRSFAQAGVRFIQGAEPDETRWLPKNQAYARLSSEATGELLLFCGVDVLFKPSSIRELVSQLLQKQKDMVSVLPFREPNAQAEASLLQPMRYFWELCPPRRLFKRPPVLSTCWIVRRELLERCGGFEAVSRSVTPEAHFARQAVIGDNYSFIRSDATLGISSTKPASEQYATTVRTRYPQLHRRLEMVALASLGELLFLLGPLVALSLLAFMPHKVLFGSLWLGSFLIMEAVYYLVAVRTKLNHPFLAWFLYPVAVMSDVIMLHISLWKYEFGHVDWKGRNICIPVMRLEPPASPKV